MTLESEATELRVKYEMLRLAALKAVAAEAGTQLDPDGRVGEQAAIDRCAASGFGELSALARLVR